MASDDDVDWFAVEVTAGQTINATMTAGTGTNDFKLYPPDGGEFVGDTDVSNGTATIGTTAGTSGTYYIRIRPEGEGADYTLVANISDDGSPTGGTTESGGDGSDDGGGDGGGGDDGGGDGGDSGGPMPGFTALLAVLAVLVALFALARRRR